MESKKALDAKIRTLRLPSGREIPILGQGTWGMGEDRLERPDEIAALRYGISLGLTLIDTAEMYGDGGAEELIGEAIHDIPRERLFLVSKVLPQNATLRGTVQACDRSLRRLKTDYLDLYLLHWQGDVPVAETLEAFHFLKNKGAILDYGVSNFDRDDLRKATALRGGDEIVTNQVLYNLLHRGIEWDLLPWCRRHGIPIMAYSPMGHSRKEQERVFEHPQMKAIAERHDAKPSQIALAWLLQQETVAIPKAVSHEHVQDNRAAPDITLTERDLEGLDRTFPPPEHKIPLEVI
jgi:diketogulonate reductase-like aldo/keto reductase